MIHPGRRYDVFQVQLQCLFLCYTHHRCCLFLKKPSIQSLSHYSLLNFFLSFRNLPWNGFYSHWLLLSFFKSFLISILYNSSFLQSNTAAPFLIIPNPHGLMLSLLMYSLFTFSFISLFMMEYSCNILKYLYRSKLTSLVCFPSGTSITSFEPYFLFSRAALHTCPHQIPNQHHQKKFTLSKSL